MLEIEPFFVENRNEQPLERVSGTLWAWGYNRHGELGIGTAGETYPQYSYSSPIQVGTLNTWSSVACGWLQAFGQMQDGSLFSWGFNDGLGPSTLYGGQLGLGIQLIVLLPLKLVH